MPVRARFTSSPVDAFIGEMGEEEADGYALNGDPLCGDQMKLWIRVEENRIADIKFKSFGCPGAIATNSMATHLARGRDLEKAMGLEPRLAQGSVRFSLGHDNTVEEIDQTLQAMAKIVPQLCTISTFS